MDKPREKFWIRGASVVALAAALTMIIMGVRLKHTVFDKGAVEFGVEDPIVLTEYRLNADSTFSGVESLRDSPKLISVYDRSKPTGKKACPT